MPQGSARNTARDRRRYGPERPRAGPSVYENRRCHRHRLDKTRRHCERRHRRRDRKRAGPADSLRRHRRAGRRPDGV